MISSKLQAARHYQRAVELFVIKVGCLKEDARSYFYRLVLDGLSCPRCHRPNLVMLREGRFRCQDCGQAGDPTLMFQRCPTCDGRPALALRRYFCRDCGGEVVSRFLFDGVVYNAEYFREKMAESRRRLHERKRDAQEQQAVRSWQRSSSVTNQDAIDLTRSPGLVEALNALVGGTPPEALAWVREVFDLIAYEQHIMDTIGHGERWNLAGIAPLRPPKDRLETVRIFIACLFLEHASLLTLIQDNDLVWVRRCEPD
jgi:Zn finger protein HypA/HybF involved in hydrogenase expression